MPQSNLGISHEQIVQFCQCHHIRRLMLFGSVLRDDFRPDSDVDVLVSFAEDAGWNLIDWVDMREEIESILGREVDLVEKNALRNPFRRHTILRTKEVIYAA